MLSLWQTNARNPTKVITKKHDRWVANSITSVSTKEKKKKKKSYLYYQRNDLKLHVLRKRNRQR